MQQSQQYQEPEQIQVQVQQNFPVENSELETNDRSIGVVTTESNVEHQLLTVAVKKDRTRRVFVIGVLPLLPFAALGIIKAMLPEDVWIRLCINPLFDTCALAACFAVPIGMLKPSRRARRAAIELAQMDDLQAIGSIIDVLQYSDVPCTAAQAKETLIRLLPQLRATDSHLLNSRQVIVLQSLLKSPAFASGDLFANPFKKMDMHARLQLAILKAFEQIGDSAVLSGVRHAIDHGVNRDVKRAAAECLPYVLQRVEEAKASKTLLRGSSASVVNSGILVRPVDKALQAPIEEMLRPSAAPAAGANETLELL